MVLDILAASAVDSSSETFFGYMGVAIALVFANLGASYGTAKSGIGICAMAVIRPEAVMKAIVPVVMAGVLGIYGLIIAVILGSSSNYSYGDGYAHLASGIVCGFSSFGAGLAIGVVGDSGVRANAMQDSSFVGMILILIFSEALGLYGLIVAIILSQK